MKIEVLGMGCTKCKQLAENAEAAVKELKVNAEVAKVTEIEKITDYGVMMTPALAMDGTVVSAGRVLSKDEIKKIISGKAERSEKNDPGCSGGCPGGCCR